MAINDPLKYIASSEDITSGQVNRIPAQMMQQSGLAELAPFPGFANYPVLPRESGVRRPWCAYGTPERYGATGNGHSATPTDDSAAILACANAAAVTGQHVTFAARSYFVARSIALPSGVTLQGAGGGTALVGGVADFITAVSRTDIRIRDLRIVSNNNRLLFNLCSRLEIANVVFDGLRANRELTQQGIWTKGCAGVRVLDCTFRDYRDALYLDQAGTTVTSDVLVRGSRFRHDNHGALDSYVTGVYLYNVGDVGIVDCEFTDLHWAKAVAGAAGYGVYEGDGVCQSVRISGCRFDSRGANADRMIGVLVSRAMQANITDCTFNGAFRAIDRAAQHLMVTRCVFNSATVSTSSTENGHTAYVNQTFSENSFVNTQGMPLEVMRAGAPDLQNVVIANNTFFGASRGAVRLRYVTHAVVVANTLIDCNTTKVDGEGQGGGINFYGCTDGFVDGNTVMNIKGGGMHHGVVSSATQHTIDVTPNNRIRDMTVGRMRTG